MTPATSATGEPSDGCVGKDAGATLLEMLVVMALLVMIGGLTLASYRPVLRRASLAAARSELLLGLAEVRAEALRQGSERDLHPTGDGTGYVAAGRRIGLPPGVRVASEPGRVSFFADGRSPGARLRLSLGGRILAVTVAAGSGLAVSTGPG